MHGLLAMYTTWDGCALLCQHKCCTAVLLHVNLFFHLFSCTATRTAVHQVMCLTLLPSSASSTTPATSPPGICNNDNHVQCWLFNQSKITNMHLLEGQSRVHWVAPLKVVSLMFVS
jgi:hypothetical protein